MNDVVGLGTTSRAILSIDSSSFTANGVEIGGNSRGDLSLEGTGATMNLGFGLLVVGAGPGGGGFEVSFGASYQHGTTIIVGQGGSGSVRVSDAYLGAVGMDVGNNGNFGSLTLDSFNETELNIISGLVIGKSGEGLLETFAVGFGGDGTCDPFDPFCDPSPPEPPGLGGVPNVISTTAFTVGDGARGEARLVGTQVNASFTQVGVNAAGVLDMRQSVLNLTGGFVVATNAQGDATLNASEVHADFLDINRGATGSLRADNSVFVINDYAIFGNDFNTSHELTNGTAFSAASLAVGWETTGNTVLLMDNVDMTVTGHGDFGAGSTVSLLNNTVARFGDVFNRGFMTVDGTSEVQTTIEGFVNEGVVYMPGVAANIDTTTFENTATGLLTGNGWVTQVDNAGFVRPGADNAAGFIAVDTEYVQQASGTTFIELGGTTPDTEHDRVWVDAGDARLGGLFNISLINGYFPALNDTFHIVQADNVLVPAPGPDVLFDFSDLPEGLEFDAAIVTLPDNRQALRLQVSNVPEPTSLALLILGCLLTAGRRSRLQAA